MARAIWSGSISFGLVAVPVKAYPAIRDRSLHFNQLEKGTGSRIRYTKVSEKTNKEVPAEKIESGYQVSRGHFVVVNDEELERLRPQTTRTIDISDFVDLSAVDPAYYERTYWLAPDGRAAERAYRLLRSAMDDRQQAGVGCVVMRNKQYLAAIRPLQGALAMSTMRFADEVIPASDIEGLRGSNGKADAKELKLATQIIDSLSTDWDPRRYHDTYTEELKHIIDQKAKGQEVVVEEEGAPTEAKVVDLMEALEKSLAAAGKGRSSSGTSQATASKARTRKSASSRAGKSTASKSRSRSRKSA